MNTTRWVCLLVGVLAAGFVLFPATVQAGVGLSPSSLSFGSVTVNSTTAGATVMLMNNSRQTMIIQSISSSEAQFLLSTPVLPFTIAPHSNTSIQVAFRPGAAVAYNGSVVITFGRRAGSDILNVSGTGIPAPQTHLLSANASRLSFASVVLGKSLSQGISLTNTGTGTVTISQINTAGTGFSVSGFTGATTLAAGNSLALNASFTPALVGIATGTISVLSNATNSPAVISISGIGVQPQISAIPSTISFGNVTVGVNNTQTVTIGNPGTAYLTVTQATISGASFTSSGLTLPLSVAPGGSATFSVGFAPASANNFPGSITLVNSSPTSPIIVPLSGTGIATTRTLVASASSLAFGSLTEGTSAIQNVTLTNTGNGSLSISQMTLSGSGYSATGLGLPLTLAAGQATTLGVTFAPNAAGSLPGSITIVSNASNSTLALSLSGTGTAPVTHSVNLSWTPSASSYSGFHVYRASASGGPYSRLDSSMVSTAAFSDTGVSSGASYYYVATQVDSTGIESAYSTEATAIIP